MVKKSRKKGAKKPAKPKVTKTAKVVKVTQKPTKKATKIEIVVKTAPTKVKTIKRKTTKPKKVTKKATVKKKAVRTETPKKPAKRKTTRKKKVEKIKKPVATPPKSILHRKVGKRQKKEKISKEVKPKFKFSAWWLLPPPLRPKHAKVVKATELETVSATGPVSDKTVTATIEDSRIITTGIDKLLAFVEEKEKVTFPETRIKLGLSEETMEEWVSLLESHKFIVLYYPTIGPAILMSPEYAAKHKLQAETPIKETKAPKKENPAEPKKEKKIKLPFRRRKNE